MPNKKNPDINEPNNEKASEVPEINEAETENSAASELNAVLETVKKELDEMKDLYLRTLAEYDNYRKRTVKEKEAIYGDAKANVLKQFLPIADNFERAMINSANEDFESFKQGVSMIINQFLKVLSDEGLKEFGAVGDSFDPNIHNCVMHEENPDLGENVISEVFQKGYMLSDRVVRAAVVKVAN